MTQVAWALLATAIGFAAADWFAMAHGKQRLRWLARPGAVLLPHPGRSDHASRGQCAAHRVRCRPPLLAGRGRPPPPRSRAMAVPVAAYLVAISAMVALAAASGRPAAPAGAALFLASDCLLAWNRFVRPLAWSPLPVIVTYHLGQVGLVPSLAG